MPSSASKGMSRRNEYAEHAQPCTQRTTRSAAGSPQSMTRMFSATPDTRIERKLCLNRESPAGNISSGGMRQESDQLDLPTQQTSDQADSERHVTPACIALEIRFEWKLGPSIRIGRSWEHRPLVVRTPHAITPAIIHEALKQFEPRLVPFEEAKPSHDFEPRQRKWDVGFYHVLVVELIAHHKVRLCDDLLAIHLHRFLRRLWQRQILVESLHLRIVLAPENRHL